MVSDDHSIVLTSDDGLDRAVDIRSKQDLLTLAEVLDSETLKVKRTTFVYLDQNEDAWFGVVARKRKQDVTVEEIKNALRRVSNTVFPLAYPTLTIFREEYPLDYYTKRPKFILLDDEEEAELLPQMFLDEIEVLEVLKEHPHPNIIRYFGCRVKDERVVGIILQRHEITLQYYFRDRDAPLSEREITGENRKPRIEVDRLLRDLSGGVEHLHSLGLAHNDLNPSNILLDEENNPVIIDFGSCRKFGERLVSAGTPGWMDEEYETSERQNDTVALQKIEAWLNENQHVQ